MNIESKLLGIEDIYTLSTESLIEAYRNGYSLEERPTSTFTSTTKKLGIAPASVAIKGLATCNGTSCPCSIVQNTIKTLSVSASSGTPPYTYHWQITKPDGTIDTTPTGTPVSYTFSQVGSYGVSVYVTDSCSGGALTSNTDSCTITVTAPACPSLTCSTITCPTSVVQGSSATFSTTWSGGTPGYTVYFYKDSDTTPFAQGGVTSTSISLGPVVNWTVGTHAVYALVTDSCSTGSKNCYSSNTCTLSVTAPAGVGYNCISGACQPAPSGTTGTYGTLSACQSACTTAGAGYNCISPGNCQPAPSGTTGTYPDITTCNAACPIAVPGCTNCDLTTNYCVAGQCVPKTYAFYGAVGFGALVLLSVLK